SDTIVKANVEASMSLAKRYPVHAVLCQDGRVVKASCACKAGQGGVCKHVTALLWHMLDLIREGQSFIPDALACTEGARQWGPSSSRRGASTTVFKELDFVKHDPNNKSKSARKTTEVHVDVPQAALKRLHTDFVEKDIFPMFADVIKDAEFTALPRKIQECPALDDAASVPRISLPIKVCWTLQMPPNDPCVITLAQAQSLEEQTRGQSKSTLWHSERGKRITASQFGDIVKRKAAVNEKFLRNIFSGSRGATHHMKAGLKNEAAALKRYKTKKRVQVFSVGLCVNPGLPMLGASPDGLVWDEDVQEYGLVEVKTVSRAIDAGLLTFEQVVGRGFVDFVKEDKTVDTSHKHHHQMTGQLALTGLGWCDLVVDWEKDCWITRVPFDEKLWVDVMVPRLTDFFFKHRKPERRFICLVTGMLFT
ncbi:MAG: YqaJ viral recombinase family protein, partial [Anaplasma sp.]|nr:YqaJ viral recombinase family protein [Anaplasma sp.]